MRHNRSILLLLLVLFPVIGWAQEKYTDKLQERSTSGAVVVVHQDADIEELVNGTVAVRRDSTSQARLPRTVEKTSGPHTKANGYRVQIYMAGNTAQDKAVVKSYAKRFKARFPSVNAYVMFNSPHWVCMVGDYTNKRDAQAMLDQVRGSFNTAYIVRSKINSFK